MSDEYRWDNEQEEVVEETTEIQEVEAEQEEEKTPQMDTGYAPRYDYDYSQVGLER